MKAAADDVGIRLWRPGDEALLPQLANNRRIWRNLTDRFPHPYGHEDAVRWIHSANQRPDEARHFAVLTGDRVVGGVGFERLKDLCTRTAEIGYWVGESHWGQGIATRALRLATECAFRGFDFGCS